MPPVRRASRQAHPAGSPYPDGWLSRRRHRRVRGNLRKDSDGSGGAPPSPTSLPDDLLFGIFSRVSDLTDAARCAATCRRWGRAVATRAAPICRALAPPPGGFHPHLALGVFIQHQDKDEVSRRWASARGGSAAQLRFVPTELAGSRARLLGEGGAAALFNDARPVASRNGRVVLELRREARADGLALCVWNPVTGDVAVPPPLAGKEFPGYDYACTIITGDDLDVPVCSPDFFRLLLVYGRPGFTALRSYSSDTSSWGLEVKKPGAKISGRVLRRLAPAVVVHGVAYWPMNRRAAFGVRLGGTAAAMDTCSVPYTFTCPDMDSHMLGVSTDGRLNFVDFGIFGFLGRPNFSFSTSELLLQDVVGYKSATTSVDRSDHEQISIDLPQIKVTCPTLIKLQWFGEKSGTLIFTVEETSSTSAVFALNVATRSLEKLAEGVSNHACCRRLYGYEMDHATLLASVAP